MCEVVCRRGKHLLIQGKRLMPEVVSDLDDTCAPSHPPFLTLIFQVCCSGHFWILGKVKLLGANENSKGLFFHLHDSPVGPKMLSGSREAKRYICDYLLLCWGSVSLCVDIKCDNETRYIVWLYIISMVLFSYLFCQYAETLLTKLHRRVLYHFWLCTWCILFVYERIFLKTLSN